MDDYQPAEEFTDEDFNYSAAQFDVDYLERISSEGDPQQSTLARESLYVKFDPLVGKGSPRKGTKSKTRQEEIASNDLMMMNTPPSKGESRLPIAASVDTDTSNTPLSTGRTFDASRDESPHYDSDSMLMTPEEENLGLLESTDGANMHIVSEQQEELKYTEDEAVYMIKAAELEGSNSIKQEYEGQIEALKKELAELQRQSDAMGSTEQAWQPTEDNCRGDVAFLDQHLQEYKNLDSKLTQLDSKMSQTIDKELEGSTSDKEKQDSVDSNYTSIENSFNDLLQRHIKLKQETERLYKSQEGLKHRIAELEKINSELLNKKDALTEDSWKCIDEANGEYESLRKELSSKLALERANSKRLELQVKSMEKSLEKKEQDKQHLANLCEQVMSGLQ